MAEKVFTKNEAEAMLHINAKDSYRRIAAHVEEHNYTAWDIIDWLRELADEAEAQSIVVTLRDQL